ncbi:hypothetical protein H0H87_003607 [Tephrocybe sp. NHM501043]|nr:hypothetical protein H0H87_003607 [Tephrocybe sp. NHM501043]
MAWGRFLIFAILSRTIRTLYTQSHPQYAAQDVLEGFAVENTSGLPVSNSTHSFWINTPGANPLAKEGSEGDLTPTADVCIIGSGITGVSSAYYIAKALDAHDGRQAKAIIIDARDFCQKLSFREKEQKYGREQAKKSYALEQYTTSKLAKMIRQEDWESAVDLVSSEHLRLLLTEAEAEQTRLDFAAARAAGVDLQEIEWLSADEVRNVYGASFPAFRYPGNNVWPLKVVTRLFKLAQSLNRSKLNLTLHTNTPVTAISTSVSESRKWTLSTTRGSIECSYVLHATNGYASYLLPHMHGPEGIVPTRGQVLAMRAAVPAVNITKASLGADEAYWFPRPVDNPDEDHPLILLGGGRYASGPRYETYMTDDSTVNEDVGKILREFLPRIYPGRYEKGREPEMEWADEWFQTGIMGYTKIGDPFVGPVIGYNGAEQFKGQYISAGYTGHGMTRAFAWAQYEAQIKELKGEILEQQREIKNKHIVLSALGDALNESEKATTARSEPKAGVMLTKAAWAMLLKRIDDSESLQREVWKLQACLEQTRQDLVDARKSTTVGAWESGDIQLQALLESFKKENQEEVEARIRMLEVDRDNWQQKFHDVTKAKAELKANYIQNVCKVLSRLSAMAKEKRELEDQLKEAVEERDEWRRKDIAVFETVRQIAWEKATVEERERCRRRDTTLCTSSNRTLDKTPQWDDEAVLPRILTILNEFERDKFSETQPLTFHSIPWPILDNPLSSSFGPNLVTWVKVEEFFRFARSRMFDSSPVEYRTLIQKIHRLFHPDKWRSRAILESVYDPQERKFIEVAGNIVAQAVTPIWQEGR